MVLVKGKRGGDWYHLWKNKVSMQFAITTAAPLNPHILIGTNLRWFVAFKAWGNINTKPINLMSASLHTVCSSGFRIRVHVLMSRSQTWFNWYQMQLTRALALNYHRRPSNNTINRRIYTTIKWHGIIIVVGVRGMRSRTKNKASIQIWSLLDFFHIISNQKTLSTTFSIHTTSQETYRNA